jgi:hypothetical protein
MIDGEWKKAKRMNKIFYHQGDNNVCFLIQWGMKTTLTLSRMPFIIVIIWAPRLHLIVTNSFHVTWCPNHRVTIMENVSSSLAAHHTYPRNPNTRVALKPLILVEPPREQRSPLPHHYMHTYSLWMSSNTLYNVLKMLDALKSLKTI